MRQRTFLLPLCTAAFLAPPTSAQARGPAAIWASGLSLESTSGLDPLLINQAGDQLTPPVPGTGYQSLSGPTPPDYTLSNMFPGLASMIEIDALSTGNDLVMVDPSNGQILINNRWAAFSVSVNRHAQGLPGSYVESRRLGGTGFGVGADIFSYWAEDSVDIGEGVAGQVFLEQGAEHMGLTIDSEVDAFDWFLRVVQTRSGFPGVIFLTFDTIYFSLTSNSADQLAQANIFLDGAIPSGAAVYAIQWQQDPQSLNWSWSDPLEVYSPAELDLLPTDEVDAIGVNPFGHSIVFSTSAEDSTFGDTQLMVTGLGFAHAVQLRDTDGATIVSKLGLTTEDDIDAVCDFDPEGGLYSPFFGIPYEVPAQAPMSISMTREIDLKKASHTLVVGIDGWPAQGAATLMQYLVGVDVDFALPAVTIDAALRNATQNHIEFRVPINAPDMNYYGGHNYPGVAAYLAGHLDPLGWNAYSWAMTFRF